VQAQTMLEKGHLDHAIRICVEEGIPALQAIQMATLNAAECCELKDRGAIAPGLRADMLVVRDLEQFDVVKTFIEGNLLRKQENIYCQLKGQIVVLWRIVCIYRIFPSIN